MFYRKNCEYALANAYYLSQGESRNAYDFLGSHRISEENGIYGYSFVFYERNALQVSLVGDFNDGRRIPMTRIGKGLWYTAYKSPMHIEGSFYEYLAKYPNGETKSCYDPFSELAVSDTGKVFSTVRCENSFIWSDKKYMSLRKSRTLENINIHEVKVQNGVNYRELSESLVSEASKLGFIHVKIYGVRDFFEGDLFSGCFTPSSRYGSSDDFSYLVNELHSVNVGVIVELFPTERRVFASDVRTPEARSILLSSAMFWARIYHVDGICVNVEEDFDTDWFERALQGDFEDVMLIIKVG